MHWSSGRTLPAISPSITWEESGSYRREAKDSPVVHKSATIEESIFALKEDEQRKEGKWSCLTGASIFLRQALITRRRTPDRDQYRGDG